MLAYDAGGAARKRGAGGILPGYTLGMLAAGIVYSGVGYFVVKDAITPEARWINGAVVPVAFAVVMLLPALFWLGITLWVRLRWIAYVRVGRFREAFAWGIAAGMYPMALYQQVRPSGEWQGRLLLAGLTWHMVFPLIAGWRLTARSHMHVS